MAADHDDLIPTRAWGELIAQSQRRGRRLRRRRRVISAAPLVAVALAFAGVPVVLPSEGGPDRLDVATEPSTKPAPPPSSAPSSPRPERPVDQSFVGPRGSPPEHAPVVAQGPLVATGAPRVGVPPAQPTGAPAKAAAREPRIVFSSRRSGNGEVYTMRLDGSDVERVSYSRARRYNDAGDWSPDGRWIAYGSGANGLVVVRPDGDDARVVAKNSCVDPEPNLCPGDLQPSWSPDGKWLVFQRGQIETADCAPVSKCPSLWLVRADGTGLRRLADSGRDPHWSPDGQRIVFADVGGLSNSCNLNSSERDCPGPLFTIRPDGTDQRALGLVGDTPRWSPDGLRIVYGNRPAEGAPHDLFVVELSSGQVRQVTSGPGASGGASWSPDGTTLIYHYLAHEDEAGDSGPDYEIYLRRLDGKGGARRLTTSNGLDMLPRFSPA